MTISRNFNTYYTHFLKLREKLRDKKEKRSMLFRKIRNDFYKDLWFSASLELGVEIEDVGYGFYKIRAGEAYTYVKESLVMLDNHVILKMAGNKPLIHKILSKNYYPIIKYVEYDIPDLNKAYQFFNSIDKPVVVKPADASAGKGITTGIESRKDLKKASLWASVISRNLIIEEEIDGYSFRLLYLNGKFIDAIKRNSPQIVGDGKNSIKQLINHENTLRLNSDKITSLHPLTMDLELIIHLKSHGFDLNNVLPEHKKISVKRVVNQNSCRENESVKTLVHPSIIETGSQISKLLNIQLSGIDIMSKDISKPLNETGGIISEVNTTPGLHHHYLINNEEAITPIALLILKTLLDLD